MFGFGSVDTAFPLFGSVFLVALGIDNNIFLMTQVRGEAIRRGALAGLAATGGSSRPVSCSPAHSPSWPLSRRRPFIEIGLVVAFGHTLATIIVRPVLVTALNLDAGRWMWWPSTLARKPDPAPEELSQERAISGSHSQVEAFERLPWPLARADLPGLPASVD